MAIVQKSAAGGRSVGLSATGGEMPEYQFVNSIAALSKTDPEAAKTLLEEYGGDLDPAELERVGILPPKAPEQADTSFLEKAKDVGGGALVGFMDLINRPSQAVLKGIQAATGNKPGFNAATGAWEGLTDTGEQANLRDAVGVPHNAEPDFWGGDKVIGAFDTVGTAALDPLTWLSFGTSSAAKAGLKAVAGSAAPGLGEATAKTASKSGLRFALGEAGSDIATEGGKRLSAGAKFGRAAEEAASPARLELRQALLDAAEAAGAKDPALTALKQEKALEKGAQGGLKVLGTTVLPGATAGKPFQAAGILDKTVRTDQTAAEVRRLEDLIASAEGPPSETLLSALQDEGVDLGEFMASRARIGEKAQLDLDQVLRTGSFTESVRPGLTSKARSSTLGKWTQDAFVPRAEIKRGYENGDELADAVARINTEAQAGRATANNAAIGHLKTNVTKLDETTSKALLDANDIGGSGSRAFAEEAAARGDTKLADHANAIATVDDETYRVLREDLGVPEESLMDQAQHQRRFFTPEGMKFLDRIPENNQWGIDVKALKAEASAGGSLNARTFMPDETINTINKVFEKEGVKKLIEDNPTAIALRHNREVNAAAAQHNIINGLSGLMDEAGRPVLSLTKEPAAVNLGGTETIANTADMLPVEVRPGVTVYADAPIAHDLEKTLATVTNDQAIKGFGGVMDKWMGLWKGYATVPVLTGTGFHARNLTGNLFLNYLAGVSDVRYYKEAQSLQRAMPKAEKLLLDPEINGDLAKALERSGLSPELAKRGALAREKGIDVTGYIHSDLPADELRKVPGAKEGGAAAAVGRGINPLDRGNAVIRSGQKVGETIENNARLANFLHGLDHVGSADEAAARVKRYLFDYGDLTAFEKTVMKRIVPFYTFLRNNTPLMVQESVRQPGKFSIVPKIQKATSDPEGMQGAEISPFALQQGMQPLGKGLSEAISGPDTRLLAGIELPTNSAAKVLNPLTQAISMIPGVGNVLPSEFKPKQGGGEAIRQIANMPGGGINELAKYGIEKATGNSLYTGAPTKQGDAQEAIALANTFLPQVRKGVKLNEKATTGSLKDQITGPGELRAQLLDSVFGINTATVSDESQEKEKQRRKFDVNEVVSLLKKEGVDVPTFQDLVKAGVFSKKQAPPLPLTGEKKAAALKKAKEKKLAEREALLALRAKYTEK